MVSLHSPQLLDLTNDDSVEPQLSHDDSKKLHIISNDIKTESPQKIFKFKRFPRHEQAEGKRQTLSSRAGTVLTVLQIGPFFTCSSTITEKFQSV